MSVNSITQSSFSAYAASTTIKNEKGTVTKESVAVSVSASKTVVSGDSFLPSDRIHEGNGVYGGYAPSGIPKSLRGLYNSMLGYSETTATTQAEKARYASMSFEELAESIGMGTTPEAAAAAISEDGLWGVNAVSTRLMDMAMSLSKGDPEMAEELRAAVQKGFEAVGALSSLPQVCQNTYTETMARFDYWAENGSLEGYGDTQEAESGKYELRLSGTAYDIGAIKAQKDGNLAYDKVLEVRESFDMLTKAWRMTAEDPEDPQALRQLDELRTKWVTELRDKDPAGFRAWVEIHIAPNAMNGDFDKTIKPEDFTMQDMEKLLKSDIMEYRSGFAPMAKDIIGFNPPIETKPVENRTSNEPGVYTVDRLVTVDYLTGKDKTNDAALTMETENVLFYKMPDGRTVPVLASQLRKEAAAMDAAGTGMINGRSRTEAVEDFLKDQETVVEVFRFNPSEKNWMEAEYKLHGATFTYGELEAAQTFMEKLGTTLRENGSMGGTLDYDDYASMGLGESHIRAFGKEKGFSDEQIDALLVDYRNTLNELVEKNLATHPLDTQATHLPSSKYFLTFRMDQEFDLGDRKIKEGTLASAPDLAVNWEMIRSVYETMAGVDQESSGTLESAIDKFMDEALVARMAGTIRPDWAHWRISVYEENIRKFQTAMAQYLSGVNS